MRVLADVFSGGAGMIVRVDSVTPSPAILGEDTEVELHKADPAVSERQIGLADVGGMEPIIKRLRELVELPLLRPGFYRRLGVRPPKGVLLYGPPGTGKTLTCRALANELGVSAFKMSSTELVGNVQGETEANLRLLFSRALAHAPSLVLIDEFDVIATHRERLASQSDVRAASQLLTLMDGLEEVDGIVLVATTNRVQAIDPAFRRPGRFEEEIFVGPPSEESRAEILSIHTREMPLSRSGQEAIGELAAATGGFVGADIMHLARSAGLEAARRLAKSRQGFEAADFLEGQHVSIEREDFENALRTVRPSVLRDVVTRMERIAWPQIAGLPDLKDRADRGGRSGARPQRCQPAGCPALRPTWVRQERHRPRPRHRARRQPRDDRGQPRVQPVAGRVGGGGARPLPPGPRGPPGDAAARSARRARPGARRRDR